MKIKKLTPTAIVPTKGTAGAACWDMYADVVVPTIIEPGQSKLISTGVAMAIPAGKVGLLFPRSGLAAKQNIRLANCVGVIDSDYRGEVKAALYNDGSKPFLVEGGMRIAQLMIVDCDTTEFDVVDDLDETERGEGGFGSTGIR